MKYARRAISRLNDFVILGNKISVELAKFKGKRHIWKRTSAVGNSEMKQNGKDVI